MLKLEMLKMLDEKKEWDIIIIGGGATGLGTAVDAAIKRIQNTFVRTT